MQLIITKEKTFYLIFMSIMIQVEVKTYKVLIMRLKIQNNDIKSRN